MYYLVPTSKLFEIQLCTDVTKVREDQKDISIKNRIVKMRRLGKGGHVEVKLLVE
jgi:hypothetical protein